MTVELAAVEDRLTEIDAQIDAAKSVSDWYRLTNEKTRLLEQFANLARAAKFGAPGPGVAVSIPNYACKADGLTRGLPVCMAVRKDRSGQVVSDGGATYRVTADGRKTTLGGRAIIDSKEQRELHKKRWGMTEAE